MTTPWPPRRTAGRPLAPCVAVPREPVDPARIGRRVVRRRAKGMDAGAVAAALEDARFDARQTPQAPISSSRAFVIVGGVEQSVRWLGLCMDLWLRESAADAEFAGFRGRMGDRQVCSTDLAAKEAEIARFLQEHPRAGDAGRGHPALRGCEEVRWSEFPECPATIPAVLHGLLDQAAAPEAKRVLTNSILNSVREMNAAMPAVLPFLLRLAGDPQVPVRCGLLDLVVSIAGFSEPIDGRNEAMERWFGSDSDHPEREQCRAVFAEHASLVAMLAEQANSPDARAKLRQAAGLL